MRLMSQKEHMIGDEPDRPCLGMILMMIGDDEMKCRL